MATGNMRVTLPPAIARKLRTLAEHRETAPTAVVEDLIDRAYRKLGLQDHEMDALDWKAPEARY